ncbi:MAG: DNA primase [Nitrospirae bacterium]|nr:DNA primase [Nitrospirota bacterium]
MPPYDDIREEIKSRVDIVDLVSDYLSLKKTGQNWRGLCPFHTEKTPSFTVSPAKQIYHCFGCGSGGDIFSFLVNYENLTFNEALKVLAKRAGVTLKPSQKSDVKAGEKEALYNIHNDALAFFRQNLAKSQEAIAYLNKRGIESDAQKLFEIGYASKSWDALLAYLKRKGYAPEIMKKAGLITQGAKGSYDTFRERIIFPINDLKGDVIAFGGRAVNGSEPKYLNSPETLIFNKRGVLYGLNRAKHSIKETGKILLMEGYIDVITAHLHGFTNTVAPLGTALTTEHGILIRRFTENVILVFDGDKAGVKATKSAASALLESGLNVKILSLPDKEDPDSFIRKNGKEAFIALLENPLSIIDFFMIHGGDKNLTAREAIEVISRMPDGVLQGDYVRMLSERIGVNESFIIQDLKKIKKQSADVYNKPAAVAAQQKHKPKPQDEVSIIKLLLYLPEEIERVSRELSAEDFNDKTTMSIYKKIMEGFTDFNDLIMQCKSAEEKDFLTKVSLREDLDNPKKELIECIERFRSRKRKIRLDELQIRIKDAELKKDNSLLRTLLGEHKFLKSGGN